VVGWSVEVGRILLSRELRTQLVASPSSLCSATRPVSIVYSRWPFKKERVEGSRGCLQRWARGEALAASSPPAGCSADHATTSDRYSSMRFDTIDTLVYMFDSPSAVLSIRARGRCPGVFVARKFENSLRCAQD
jgi:hypothetical protein